MVTFLFRNHLIGDQKKWNMERKKQRAEESKETEKAKANRKYK
jgi:hypothetical protein